MSQLDPHTAADKKVEFTGYYSRCSQLLEDILERKPRIWMELRKDNKSDKATDRAWDATEDGINEMKLRLKMKRLEKEISSLSSYLRVAEKDYQQSV